MARCQNQDEFERCYIFLLRLKDYDRRRRVKAWMSLAIALSSEGRWSKQFYDVARECASFNVDYVSSNMVSFSMLYYVLFIVLSGFRCQIGRGLRSRYGLVSNRYGQQSRHYWLWTMARRN